MEKLKQMFCYTIISFIIFLCLQSCMKKEEEKSLLKVFMVTGAAEVLRKDERIELQKELSKPADTLEEQRELEKALPGTEFPLESYKKTQRPSLLEERLLPFRN